MVPEGENVCDECGSRICIGSKDDYEDIDDQEDKATDISANEEKSDEMDEVDNTLIELDEDFDIDNLDQHMENLLKLPGVGPLRAKILLKAGYDNLRKLKRASVMELVKIKGIGRKSAGEIKTALRDIDLEEIRKKKLDKAQIEAELSCPLCNTIVCVYEVACYECGTALKDHHTQIIEGDADSMALAYYDTKLKEDPKNSELWYARGATLIKMEEFDKALASFDKSLEIDPNYQNVWISKAEVFNKIGEPMKAAECYSHVISASTDADDDYEEIGNGFDLVETESVDDVIAGEETIDIQDEPVEEIQIEGTGIIVTGGGENGTSIEENDIGQDIVVGDGPDLDTPSRSLSEPQDEPEEVEIDQSPKEFSEKTTAEVIEEVSAGESITVEEEETIEPEEAESGETIELVEADDGTEGEMAPQFEPVYEQEPTIQPEPDHQEPEEETKPHIEVEPEPIIEETVVEPSQEMEATRTDMVHVQEEIVVEIDTPKPARDPNDPTVLKKSLSIHAVAIKPLLILAKELNIDVLAQKKIIAQGVNESKKKNLGGAVALMKQGRRQIEEAFTAKANEDLGTIAGLSRDLKLEGHNVERISNVIALAKELLEKGEYKECFDKMNVALAMVENIRAEGV